jgi:hypothetical protein
MITITSNTYDLDSILQVAKPGSSIKLESGQTYYTRGAWAFQGRGHISLPEGCRLDATGAIIMLRDAVRSASTGIRQDRDLPIMWCGRDCTIEGGLWDCNAAGHQGWLTQGIRFFGKFRIHNAHIKGMRGTRTAGITTVNPVESFAISSEGDTAGSMVNGCRVTCAPEDDLPDNYVSGIFMGSTSPSSTDISIIQNSEVYLGQHGQFAFAANGSPCWIARCEGKASRGFYNDTGDTVVELEDCRLRGHYAAISVVANQPCRRFIQASDCELSGERAVEWNDRDLDMTGTVVLHRAKTSGRYRAAVLNRVGRGTIVFSRCVHEGEPGEFFVHEGSVGPIEIKQPR